jgi:MtN3 and saliva related transmembrane protein
MGGKHLDWKELIGFIGGFLTTMGMVPQVYRLFKLKSAHEISLTFSLSLVIGIALWLVYGILNGLMSVIIWNGIALVLGSGVLYAKMKWGRNQD